MKAELVLVEGELEKRLFAFDRRLAIGRRSEGGIRIPSPKVSRRHCLVEAEGEVWTLRDLGSRNGTFLNGVPVRQSPLTHGDRISISEWTFLFLYPASLLSEGRGNEATPPAARPEGAAVAWQELAATPTEELTAEGGFFFAPERLLAEAEGRPPAGLDVLLKLCRRLPAVTGLGELESVVLPLALEAVPADRVVLHPLSAGLEGWQLEVWRQGPGPVERPLSSTILNRVARERTAVFSNRVPNEEHLRDSASVSQARVGSVLVVPLLASPTRVLGVLYLDSGEDGAFRLEHLKLMTAFAGMLAPQLLNLRYLSWLEQEVGGGEETGLMGESAAMEQVAAAVARVAGTDSTVILRGESGTGKEVVARDLHRRSRRARRPFVAINCATLSDTLLESELFGHEKGAFTGAVERKAGKLEVADGGTLFLDEIGDLPMALQAKLLRVLESFEFQRVGGTKTLRVDVRILAATHQDLESRIREGRFRADLFYRLNVIEIKLPPLRQRPEDIHLFANHFLAHYSKRLGKPPLGLQRDVLERLKGHSWPGNVRELRNAMERAVVLADGDAVELMDLPEAVVSFSGRSGSLGRYQEGLRETKVRLIRDALSRARGNVTEAARRLGLSPNYLHRLMTHLQLRGEPGGEKTPPGD